jgi:hypothetical protein
MNNNIFYCSLLYVKISWVVTKPEYVTDVCPEAPAQALKSHGQPVCIFAVSFLCLFAALALICNYIVLNI